MHLLIYYYHTMKRDKRRGERGNWYVATCYERKKQGMKGKLILLEIRIDFFVYGILLE